MALDGEHARRVVQLLGHVLADALERTAATAGRVLRLVMDFAARQMSRQCLALGLLLLACVLLAGPDLIELGLQRRQVGVDRLFEQALLLGVEGLGLGRELQSLEHRHLVVDLVDQRLLEGDLPIAALDELILGRHLGHQRAQHLAQLLRIQRVDVLLGDHGA